MRSNHSVAQKQCDPDAFRRREISVDSNLDSIAAVGAFLRSACSEEITSREESYKVEVSAMEAVTNAIKHAYGNRSGGKVTVTLTRYSDHVEVRVRDQGKAMKPKPLCDVRFDRGPIEDLPENGVGLFLMHQFMDLVAYRRKSACNILTMTKRLRQGPIMAS